MKGVDLHTLLDELNERCAPAAEPDPPQPAAARIESSERPELPAVSQELVGMALRSCYDPEIPVNIVDLGLVRNVRIDGGIVGVRMTLTAPGCPMGQSIIDDVQQTVSAVPGVRDVQVDLVFDPPWTPSAMTDEARRQLGMMTA